MADELKPCPFCGDDKPYVDVGTVECGTCGALAFGPHSVPADRTGHNWQTRPIEDALRAEVEALKAELDKCRKAYGKLFNESAALEGAAGDFDDLPMIAQMNKDAADEYRKQRDDACADVARLQAELAKYTGPLNNRQREAISMAMRVQNNPNMTKWDAAIREARGK